MESFLQHGEVVLDRHVVGDGVARAQRPPAAGGAALDQRPGVRPHLGHGGADDPVHVEPAEHGDAASPAALGLPHRLDLVLEGVLRVPAARDDVLHDLLKVAAGVEDDRLAVPVAGRHDAPVPREHVLPQHGRRHQGLGREAHVAAHDHGADRVEGRLQVHDAGDARSDGLEHGGHERLVVGQHPGQALRAEQPHHVLQHPGAPGDHPHALRQQALHVLERGRVDCGEVGPGVGLEVPPTGDGVRCGREVGALAVVGHRLRPIGNREAEALDAGVAVVVAERVQVRDVPAQAEGVRVAPGHLDAELGEHTVAELGVQLEERHTVRLALPAQHAFQPGEIGVRGEREPPAGREVSWG